MRNWFKTKGWIKRLELWGNMTSFEDSGYFGHKHYLPSVNLWKKYKNFPGDEIKEKVKN
uniref:Phage protein n=1 Tax=Meloidogyne hapla TaxID=6305 RepID=A0A1I8BC87_MELHA